MRHAKEAIAVLGKLKTIGVLLAVDDFGTGYSSLNYLQEFPSDVLKIDRSFIKKISANADDSILVSVTIGMGQSLQYLVVAGRIETQAQR